MYQDNDNVFNSLLLSVIVPVYNREKKVSNLLSSILISERSDFEVIIVNDGSTDNTEEICNVFVKKDGRCRLINKENGGVSSARNVGIDNAKGKYVFFCDSDDRVVMKTVEKMIVIADQYNVPLVVSDYTVIDAISHTDTRCSPNLPRNGIFNKTFIENNILRRYVLGQNDGLANIWNKIYSYKIIKDNLIKFDEKRTHGEDWAFNIAYFQLIESLYYLNDVCYTYYLDGSQNFLKYSKQLDYSLINGHAIIEDLNRKYSFFKTSELSYKMYKMNFYHQIISFLSITTLEEKRKKAFLRNVIVRNTLKFIIKLKNKDLYLLNESKKTKVICYLLLMYFNRLAIRV